MAPIDDDIDQLYRLPLAEFTAARNALAKRAGDRRATVQTLQKPNTAAWAVNQLYWQRRDAYEQLVRASERLRAAHARTLSGRKADVSEAEAAHADALKLAVREVEALLAAGGEKASTDVMHDIRETLQALPSENKPGRLTRPLQPLGFGALLQMLPAAARSRLTAVDAPESEVTRSGPGRSGRPVDAATPSALDAGRQQTPAEKKRLEAETRRAAAERQKKRAELDKQLKEARAAEREAGAALAKAQVDLERAEREQQRRQAALEEQKFEVRRIGGEVAALESRAKLQSEARAAVESSIAKLAADQ